MITDDDLSFRIVEVLTQRQKLVDISRESIAFGVRFTLFKQERERAKERERKSR